MTATHTPGRSSPDHRSLITTRAPSVLPPVDRVYQPSKFPPVYGQRAPSERVEALMAERMLHLCRAERHRAILPNVSTVNQITEARDARRVKVAELMAEGLDHIEISKRIGIGRQTAQDDIRLINLGDETVDASVLQRRAEVFRLREEGLTYKRIAIALGINLDTVRNDLRSRTRMRAGGA